MKKLLGCVVSLVLFFGCASPASKEKLEDKIEKTTKGTPLILRQDKPKWEHNRESCKLFPRCHVSHRSSIK
jgi:hypothetical protein